MSNVALIAPQASELLADLDKLRASIVAGEINPTTILVARRDRVGELAGITRCGEVLSPSHEMGLLAYVSQMIFNGE